MAVFNVSQLGSGKKTGGSGIGILTDQLQILENQLAKDGILTAGDYDLLIEKARSIQNMPGLTNDQRSNLDVRISAYESQQQVKSNNRAGDIERMNRSVQGEQAEDVMMAGNDPARFLSGRVASLQSKLNDLVEQIDYRGNAGDDITQYMNEYQATLSEYQEKVAALESVTNWQTKDQPIAGYVAYVKTNDRGEIVDVDYERYGKKTGFVETNGMINGFQVYGQVNFKRDGTAFFAMGNELFSGVDAMLPDPENPGAFKASRLVSTSQQRGGGAVKIGESGYKNFDPGSVPVQSYVPRNSWARGIDGTVYFRREDGGYTKHLNVNRSMEGRPDPKSMLVLPPSFEKSLMVSSDETIDESQPLLPPTGGMAPLPENQLMSTPAGQDPTLDPTQGGAPNFSPAGPKIISTSLTGDQVRRTSQQPKEYASSRIADTARRTMKAGADYVKRAIA